MTTSEFVARKYHRDRLLTEYERAIEAATRATVKLFEKADTPDFSKAKNQLAAIRTVCNELRGMALQVFATE